MKDRAKNSPMEFASNKKTSSPKKQGKGYKKPASARDAIKNHRKRQMEALGL